MAKRRGKYAGIVDHLPQYPLVEPERKDVVDAVKEKILASTPDSLRLLAVLDVDATLRDIDQGIQQINQYLVLGTEGKRWAAEFARLYAETRRIRARLAQMDAILSVTQEAHMVLMIEQMEVEGTTSLRLADGQPISTYPEPYAQVVDRDAFNEWCVKQGLLRKMQLPWQTTNMLVKNMLVNGDPEPPGVSVTAKTKVRLGSGE